MNRGRYKTRKRAFPVHGTAFAWELPAPKGNPGMLCSWARPTVEQLDDDPKPQMNAKPVKVIIISQAEFLQLRRAARAAKSEPEQHI